MKILFQKERQHLVPHYNGTETVSNMVSYKGPSQLIVHTQVYLISYLKLIF